jgi:hypothetical protein
MAKLKLKVAVAFALIVYIVAPQVAFSATDKLNCPEVLDFSDYKGWTFLNFVREAVKPSLDEFATTGYKVADPDTVMAALENVSSKVRWKVMRALRARSDAQGEATLRALIEKLQGQTVTLYTLPDAIAAANRGVDRYTLSTFIGLASCGGATIKFADNNYAYNIHYGTGKERKDNRTGRSFGAGPTRKADDASDAAYLTALEKYVRSAGDNLNAFFSTLMRSLVNSDNTGFDTIEDEGQTVLTDFLAVFTAEQTRNLMDGKVWPHWDAALLEVTLLSAFHAGQDEIKMFYKNAANGEMYFTKVTFEQVNGCAAADTERVSKQAGLIDYWQFSLSTNPEHCRRSGINITRDAFRRLGSDITMYFADEHPEVLEKVMAAMGHNRSTLNIFYELSKFLINDYRPARLGRTGRNLVAAMTEFLEVLRADAKKITKKLEEENTTVSCNALLGRAS